MNTANPIKRIDSFLYQLDDQAVNYWSGRIQANNGHPQSMAVEVATVMQASFEMLAALKAIIIAMENEVYGEVQNHRVEYLAAQRAVDKAEGR